VLGRRYLKPMNLALQGAALFGPLLVLVAFSSAAVRPAADITPPAAIVTLQAGAPRKAPQLHMLISWTAPGNDGIAGGAAAEYDLRYRPDVAITEGNWGSSTHVGGLPAPSAPGTLQSVTAVGLKPNTIYHWAIKTRDAAGNLSPISNSPSRATAKYEGYGWAAVGGGERPAVHVTSLADSGAGSLRDAVSAGARTVVFDVGGTITLATRLDLRGASHNFLTIDGSTAPPPGITIEQAAPLDDAIRIGDVDNLILVYLRLQGSFDFNGAAGELGDTLSTNSTSSSSCASNMVWDHLTVRNADDSALDLWDRVTDFTLSYCLIMHNQHPMTTGGDSPSARETLHHNLWADNGERNPQILGPHADFEYINNIVYHWGYDPHPEKPYAKGQYGVRIRNNSPGPRDVSANIVGNWFVPGHRANQALVYGSVAGRDPGEEDGPPRCSKQGTICLSSRMGPLWVSGNIFPAENCDEYSTVASARTVPAGARVTTDAAAALPAILLPSVGTHFRTPDEHAMLDVISRALDGSGASPRP
jgi:hypothetical protein